MTSTHSVGPAAVEVWKDDPAAIRQSAADYLTRRLLPLSMKALERILTDPSAPGAAVVSAARLVFEAERGRDALEDSRPRELHEMTLEEMEAELDRLKRIAARRSAQPVEPEERDRALAAAFE